MKLITLDNLSTFKQQLYNYMSSNYVTNTALNNKGYIKSVNGNAPDANGNVTVETSSGSTLPTGGSSGQILVKNSTTNGDASWGATAITASVSGNTLYLSF